MVKPIVLTGVNGNTGQVIAKMLKAQGVPFVAMAHTEARRAQFAKAGFESVLGDFDDPASLERALAGAEKAYLVCTPHEKLIPRETAFITAAKKGGVRHIVKCSAYLAGLNAESQNLRSHGVIEKALFESGMDYTILRPHGYMQTFTLFAWDMITKAGVISLPSGDGKMPLVDVRDVARVGFMAFTEPGHTGKIYDITGPEALDTYQQAEILSRILGRTITYLPSQESQLKMVMSVLGVPPTPTEHTLKIFQMQRERRPEIEGVRSTLQDLGIKPITYEEFLPDYIAGRTSGGNSFVPPDTLLVRLMNATMPVMMRTQLFFSGLTPRRSPAV